MNHFAIWLLLMTVTAVIRPVWGGLPEKTKRNGVKGLQVPSVTATASCGAVTGTSTPVEDPPRPSTSFDLNARRRPVPNSTSTDTQDIQDEDLALLLSLEESDRRPSSRRRRPRRHDDWKEEMNRALRPYRPVPGLVTQQELEDEQEDAITHMVFQDSTWDLFGRLHHFHEAEARRRGTEAPARLMVDPDGVFMTVREGQVPRPCGVGCTIIQDAPIMEEFDGYEHVDDDDTKNKLKLTEAEVVEEPVEEVLAEAVEIVTNTESLRGQQEVVVSVQDAKMPQEDIEETPVFSMAEEEPLVAETEEDTEEIDIPVKGPTTDPTQFAVNACELPVAVAVDEVQTVEDEDGLKDAHVLDTALAEDVAHIQDSVLVEDKATIEEDTDAVLVEEETTIEEDTDAVLVEDKTPIEEDTDAVLVEDKTTIEEETDAVLVEDKTTIEEDTDAVLVEDKATIEEDTDAVLVEDKTTIEEDTNAVLVEEETTIEEDTDAVLVEDKTTIEEDTNAVLVEEETTIEGGTDAVFVEEETTIEEDTDAVLVEEETTIKEDADVVLVEVKVTIAEDEDEIESVNTDVCQEEVEHDVDVEDDINVEPKSAETDVNDTVGIGGIVLSELKADDEDVAIEDKTGVEVEVEDTVYGEIVKVEDVVIDIVLVDDEMDAALSQAPTTTLEMTTEYINPTPLTYQPSRSWDEQGCGAEDEQEELCQGLLAVLSNTAVVAAAVAVEKQEEMQDEDEQVAPPRQSRVRRVMNAVGRAFTRLIPCIPRRNEQAHD